MVEKLLPVFIAAGSLIGVLLVFVIVIMRCYRQVEQGKALIINPWRGEPQVTFTGGVVFPIINKAEVMDISVKQVEIDCRGKDGLICKDNIRADINVNFFIRVNKEVGDVLKVAQSIGVHRSSDPRAVQAFFQAKFSEALKTAGKHFDFEQLYNERERFKDQIIEVIGTALNGYVLDDAAIDYLEQTPLSSLDKDNILDADGIRKITERTTAQNVLTNELRQNEVMELGAKNLVAAEAVLRFEQQRAAAEATKEREISIARSREQNEAARVASDEEKKTHLTLQKNEEEVRIAAENKERAVGTAAANREADIQLVTRSRATEVAREVELQEIAKQQDIAHKQKEIAVVVRERITVEKTVAQEEENIKTLRSTAEAQRQKEVARIAAEAEAESLLVKEVKIAEAAEEVAKRDARRKLVLAEADFESADKQAKAKIRVAEGVAAETAAPGMAQARVKEADAAATEKLGFAVARVEEQKGLATLKVQEVEVDIIRRRGEAEADARRVALVAEAAGIREKASAMHELDAASREHEEFRLRLEKEKTIELEAIRAKRELAAAQAAVMKEAFAHAKINIVGGDGAFFDRFVKAISVGSSLDGMIDQSDSMKTVFRDYLSGQRSLPEDLKGMLASPENLKNLTLSAVLGQLAAGADASTKTKLAELGARARELGLDRLNQS